MHHFYIEKSNKGNCAQPSRVQDRSPWGTEVLSSTHTSHSSPTVKPWWRHADVQFTFSFDLSGVGRTSPSLVTEHFGLWSRLQPPPPPSSIAWSTARWRVGSFRFRFERPNSLFYLLYLFEIFRENEGDMSEAEMSYTRLNQCCALICVNERLAN